MKTPSRAEEGDGQYDVISPVWKTTSNTLWSSPCPKRRAENGQHRPSPAEEKGLVPVPTPRGEVMCVHPDLVNGQQWTTVTSRKSKGKAKASSCNVVCASSREAETDVPSLTDSEEETIVLATEPNQLVAETRSGQLYSKKYDKMAATPPKPLQS